MKTEKQTRKQIIDKRLLAAGWKVNDPTQVIEEFDIRVDSPHLVSEPESPYSGHQFSDYVLLGRDRKPLAVIEAKKTSVDARKGEEQAKQYAYNIQKQYGGELPFCMYTNGYDIYFWDLGNYPPRKIYGFPSLTDLERIAFIRKNHSPLAQELINPQIAGRPYQLQAIRAIMESLTERNRKFLLVMATGTGKTRTCIGLIDTLMRAGWISRVLFLVDRIALRNQAIEAFKEHTPRLSVWPKSGEKKIAKDRRIYVSTYPTMLHIIEDPKNTLSPHFFDLIVIDESHRSIYNVYQNILNYFNAYTLGLTATPTDAIDHNTFELFNCDNGIPLFAYSFQEAVENTPRYLNNFEVLTVSTKFQAKGIHKGTISVEDQKKLMAEGKDPEEINFEGSQLEKTVTNKGTNTLIVREYMEECIKDSHGVLPGKTIFFCTTKKHARRLKDIFDHLYPQYAGELAKVIVSDDPRVYGKGGLLDQFKNHDFPRIAISVDMLDTGIDIREIVNLVFAKPVFSYTKFWQMIGRGTRLLDEKQMRPWCHKKDRFLIIDCWDNFEYFKMNPKGREMQQQVALPVRLFKMRLEKLEAAMEEGQQEIVEKEIEQLKKLIDSLPPNNVMILDHQKEINQLNEESFWALLTDEKRQFLDQIIAPLMRTLSAVDFKAMRFEKDVVEFSTYQILEDTDAQLLLREALMAQIAELPITIKVVAKEEKLISQALKTAFWLGLNEEKADILIERIAPLMRYRKSFLGDGEIKLNLEDVTYKKQMIEFGPELERVSVSQYREMVEATVKAMSSKNLILQKLKNGAELSELEVQQLANILAEKDPYVTEKLLQRVYDNRKAKFIQFIKHILGLEIVHSFSEMVSTAFDHFLAEHNNLNTQQMQFLEILRSFILDKGQLTKKDLVNPPFTQLHPQGILGIFRPQEVQEIVQLTQQLVA